MGTEHFTKEINKPENNKLKVEYENALKDKDPINRKNTLTKIINEVDKKTNKDDGSIASLTESSEKTKTQDTKEEHSSREDNSYNETKSNEVNHENINSLRSRLQAKYSKEDVSEYKQKRMNLYQEKSLKEAKEKQDYEITKEKEKNGGFIPSAKDLNAQQSLKERLQSKYSKEDVNDYKKKQEETYQNKVLDKALAGKDEGSDDEPTTPSPVSGGQKEEMSNYSINKNGIVKNLYSQNESAVLNKNKKDKEGGDIAA